jgi:hypothetical protein
LLARPGHHDAEQQEDDAEGGLVESPVTASRGVRLM